MPCLDRGVAVLDRVHSSKGSGWRRRAGNNLDMVAMLDKPVAVLVVTGPTRERLAGLFCRVYAGRNDVKIVVDRRFAERRQSVERPPVEHRRVERRRSSPWLVFPPV
jgi:hypothetical protein